MVDAERKVEDGLAEALGGISRTLIETLQVRVFLSPSSLLNSAWTMSRDAWAEDDGAPAMEMDLADCQSVYPITVSRNYGVELRVGHHPHPLCLVHF